MRGDGGVAGEGRIVGVTVTKFHSWGTCTMPLTQIGCPMLLQASDNSSLFSLNCWRRDIDFGLLQFALYLFNWYSRFVINFRVHISGYLMHCSCRGSPLSDHKDLVTSLRKEMPLLIG